jgi:predicted GNAT superfamily acetyltransferase
MKVRQAVPADFARILALNEESVHFLSPLSPERLEMLHGESAYHRVVDLNNNVEAFLLALREGASYSSANYLWFKAQFPRFLYIDRVVVSNSARGLGLGKLLYRDLFAHAASTGISPITCEYDIDPPNEPSRRFHQEFGFAEVGSQLAGGKQVSLQAVWTKGD